MIAEFYLMTPKNLEGFFQTIINAQAPPRFTNSFLYQLGFKSTNDRLLITLLKGLSFLDSNNVPTGRYFQFLDESQAKLILSEAIKDAYADLFLINTKANLMSEAEVKNKLKTIFLGKKSDKVLSLMAKTFKALCELADFKNSANIINQEPKIDISQNKEVRDNYSVPNYGSHEIQQLVNKSINTELHYNIQIHLPETKDIAVYDAIFESLKKHLL